MPSYRAANWSERQKHWLPNAAHRLVTRSGNSPSITETTRIFGRVRQIPRIRMTGVVTAELVRRRIVFECCLPDCCPHPAATERAYSESGRRAHPGSWELPEVLGPSGTPFGPAQERPITQARPRGAVVGVAAEAEETVLGQAPQEKSSVRYCRDAGICHMCRCHIEDSFFGWNAWTRWNAPPLNAPATRD